MADVARVPGVWEQIRLVAGLRWRILRNGLRKKHNQWDLIGMIVTGVFAALFVLGLCFAFYFGAYSFLSSGHEAWIAFLFWGVFLFRQLIPIFTAGFGAGFEFRTMLRFPLSLRAFYAIGLAYGLADFAAIASSCWLIAMIIGTARAKPTVLPTMIVISALFLLMNITLERMIGSWLVRILARRRAREIFFAVFILFAVSLQFLNPLLQRYGRAAQPGSAMCSPISLFFRRRLQGEPSPARHKVTPRTYCSGRPGSQPTLCFSACSFGCASPHNIAARNSARQQPRSTRSFVPSHALPRSPTLLACSRLKFRPSSARSSAALRATASPFSC